MISIFVKHKNVDFTVSCRRLSQNVTLFYLLLSLNVPHTISTNLVSSFKHFVSVRR